MGGDLRLARAVLQVQRGDEPFAPPAIRRFDPAEGQALPLALCDELTPLRASIILTSPVADQPSAGAIFFPAQWSAALKRRETVAVGQTREKSRI